jgi:hypothetical protein
MSLAVYMGIPARFHIGNHLRRGLRTGIPKVICTDGHFRQILRFVPLDLRTGSP